MDINLAIMVVAVLCIIGPILTEWLDHDGL